MIALYPKFGACRSGRVDPKSKLFRIEKKNLIKYSGQFITPVKTRISTLDFFFGKMILF